MDDLIGSIIKGIAGFYYVDVVGAGVYECKAKGIFRKEQIKPLVGDNVKIEITHEADKEGNITEILPRKNALIRPALANIDQLIVIFAIKQPDINYHLLNAFLVWMGYQNLPCIICFNKSDIVSSKQMTFIRNYFKGTGYEIVFTSAKNKQGIDNLKELMKGKISALAGPSGVGKSSIINLIMGTDRMETGALSKKTSRGKHTTRCSVMMQAGEDSFIIDTPGFSSITLPDIPPEELSICFPEYSAYIDKCQFVKCSHISEPGCAVKEALDQGAFSTYRYEEYKLLYDELKNRKNIRRKR